MTIETHPLEPFLPSNGKVLFLGSFPPPKARWSMEFFYPNWINDFWRIMGLIHFKDKHHFEVPSGKKFDKNSVIEFCYEKGFGFYDSAVKVCRLKDNASDNFLEILEPTDIVSLLRQMPECMAIVTTGGKSSEEVASILGIENIPEIGGSLCLTIDKREIKWYRVPSSSRAYPMSLENKANIYSRILKEI